MEPDGRHIHLSPADQTQLRGFLQPASSMGKDAVATWLAGISIFGPETEDHGTHITLYMPEGRFAGATIEGWSGNPPPGKSLQEKLKALAWLDAE